LKEKKTIFYYLLLSIAAIILIFIMVLVKPITPNTITFIDKIFVAVAFFTSCIFGISIAIYPNWWRKNKHITNYTSNLQIAKTSRSFQGHHPDCIRFKNHTIAIRNKTRCAGCFGLIIGSIISIFLLIIYLLITPSQHLIIWYYIFFLGLLIIPFIYIEIIFSKRHRIVHVMSNSIFIFGFFCLTISVFEITGNFFYSILTIIFCFLWLDTRIQLSKQQHSKICGFCKQTCKSY
jgi:hypothetical protein